MTILFVILILVASAILALIVLIQNPKGGGLAGNIAGFSNQFMGVKQTNDVLEKGTWIFASIIAVLCLTSSFFINGAGKTSNAGEKVTGPAATPAQPNNAAPFQQGQQQAPPATTPDSGK